MPLTPVRDQVEDFSPPACNSKAFTSGQREIARLSQDSVYQRFIVSSRRLTKFSLIIAVGLAATACGNSTSTGGLTINRLEVDLEAIGPDGSPQRLDISARDLVVASLGEAQTLRLDESAQGPRLRVNVRLLPDRPAKRLRAFASARLDRSTPAGLSWEIERDSAAPNSKSQTLSTPSFFARSSPTS